MMTHNILDHWLGCKVKCKKEHIEHYASEGHRKAQKSHRSKSHKSEKAVKKSCSVECCSMSSPLQSSQSSEWIAPISLNHSEFVFE